MPSFEMNKLQSITGVSALTSADRAKAKASPESGAPSAGTVASAPTGSAGVAVEIATPVSNAPPVDQDRVAEVRSALRDGTYPLVPAKIADAMIAAQFKFEIEE